MPFTAGQKVRASDLNRDFDNTQYQVVLADINKVSSTVMGDVTGLTFDLDANSEYLMDGFVSFYSISGVDVKFAFTGPTGMTVSWTPGGGPPINTTPDGVFNFACLETYGDANVYALNTDSSFALACRPAGYWKTGASGGTLQMRFAQFTSSANTLAIKRGSWLRLYKVV